MLANTNTFYYKLTVEPKGTGSGSVYVSTTSTNDPSYKNQSYSINNTEGWFSGETVIGNSATLSFHFYAKPQNELSIFSHWAKDSENGPVVSYKPSFNTYLIFNSGSKRNPTNFKYVAVFNAQTGLIKVRSADESKGSVGISNPDNQEGDEVTLTASPDVSNGVMFLGWSKSITDTGEYLYKNNPLELEANAGTQGTYYAHFSDAAEKVYIRLKNCKTGRFLSFYGDKNASVHQRTINGNTVQDGFVFNDSWKMISAQEAQGNPSTVFLRSGHSSGSGVTIGCNISAHNKDYNTLINSRDFSLTMESHNGKIRIYTTFSYSRGGKTVTFPSYLCDEGEGKNQNFAVMKSIMDDPNADDESTYWTLYALDETTTEGAFGANTKAKFTKGGMYYTTMFTDFPYKLLDGVNAYYLVYNEEFTEITDRVVFTQVEEKNGETIVPANTAVILECQKVQNDISSTTTVTNRLLPLLPNATGTEQIVNEGANFLKGYISVNGSTVANNKKRMYVLSANKEGVLGFHPYSKDTMTPNKAYLLIPEATDEQIAEYAKKVTFSFGEPDIVTPSDPTGIELSDQMVDEDDSTPIYNLNGTKVAEGKAAENMLRPGVYVKKGKKFVVK